MINKFITVLYIWSNLPNFLSGKNIFDGAFEDFSALANIFQVTICTCKMLVRTENVSEIYNLVVSAEKAPSYENFDNFVSN